MTNNWIIKFETGFKSLPLKKLKGDLIKMTAGRSLKIIFDDRSTRWFLAYNLEVAQKAI